MAEQRSELRVRDGLDVCLGIGGQLCEIFTGRSICALHGNGAAEADIGCGSADQNVIFSAVNFKPVGDTVPVAEGLVIQRNGDLLALSCLQEDFGKTFQLTIRPVDTGIFCMDIQLRYLGSVDFAGVLQGKDGLFVIDLQIAVGKGGIAQTVAEGKQHRNFCRAVIPIAHIEALPVFHASLLCRKIGGGGAVFILQRVALAEFAGGVDLAENHPQHCLCTRLPAEIAMDDALYTVDPRHFYRGSS